VIDDPINYDDDYSEVETCRHCQEFIDPGKEVDWNGWAWHSSCVPAQVIEGREEALRADEARDGK
jgi:hypothetical protein